MFSVYVLLPIHCSDILIGIVPVLFYICSRDSVPDELDDHYSCIVRRHFEGYEQGDPLWAGSRVCKMPDGVAV